MTTREVINLMKITLIRLPDESTPNGQRAAYDLLIELGTGTHSTQQIQDRLGLKSFAPLRSRLEHLAARGIIGIS
jgi:hypothetical protein